MARVALLASLVALVVCFVQGDDECPDAVAEVCPCPQNALLETLSPVKTDLAHVFSSGDPWVVLCQEQLSDTEQYTRATTRMLTAVRFIEEDSKKDPIKPGVLDCSAELPFLKAMTDTYGQPFQPNTMQKFNFARSKTLGFVTGYGESPEAISSKVWRSPLKLASQLRALSQPQTTKLSGKRGTTAQLKAACLSANSCLLVLTNKTLSGDESLMLKDFKRSHKRMAVAIVNATTHDFSLEGKLPALDQVDASGADIPSNSPRLFFFEDRKIQYEVEEEVEDKSSTKKRGETKAEKKKKKKKTKKKTETVIKTKKMLHGKSHRGAFAADAIGRFIEDVSTGALELKPIKSPTLKKRKLPKKLKKKEPKKGTKKTSPPTASSSSTKKKKKLTRKEREKAETEKKGREERRREQMEQEMENDIPDYIGAGFGEDYSFGLGDDAYDEEEEDLDDIDLDDDDDSDDFYEVLDEEEYVEEYDEDDDVVDLD